MSEVIKSVGLNFLLCSCPSSIAVLIVGRRKLTLPQSGMAFSVFSTFSYFRFIIRDILTKSRR